MTNLANGQSLLLNNRLWTLRQSRQLKGRRLELEVVGASEASLGMTRRMTAFLYGSELFIEQRRGGYWQANLEQDWIDGEWGPGLQCRPATPFNLFDSHTQHPAQDKFKNQFSWSYSRGAKYRHCPRAYYYHYYAAWEGWLPHAPPPVKRAYLLKNLTNLAAWTGTLVHEAIKFAMARLKAGQTVADDILIKQMRRRIQSEFNDSENGRYRQKPNQFTGLQEHYYQTGLSPAMPAEVQTKAERLLRTFLKSPLYASLQQQPPVTFLDVESLQSFTVTGTKVWVQMDLARHADGVIYLYDWKTGAVNPTEVQQQLGIYGLYARQAWPPLAQVPIRGRVYALADDRLLEFDLDDASLQAAQTAVEADIARLQSLLLNPQNNLAELRRFPMIDDLSVCQSCQFRELCNRMK